MNLAPRLPNEFIINEQEYQQCRAWLAEADKQTIEHPLEDPELETNRRRVKALVEEYASHWRSRS